MLYTKYRSALCNIQEEARSDDASVHCQTSFVRLRNGIRSLRLGNWLLGSFHLLFRCHWDSGVQENMMGIMLYMLYYCSPMPPEAVRNLSKAYIILRVYRRQRGTIPTVKTREKRFTVNWGLEIGGIIKIKTYIHIPSSSNPICYPKQMVVTRRWPQHWHRLTQPVLIESNL